MDITVLGGLPVTVEFNIQGAEPDVGIMSSYIEEWWITHINGRKCKKHPQWLQNRIDAKKGEDDQIIEQLNEYELYEPEYDDRDND
jgi:hypothetical protein